MNEKMKILLSYNGSEWADAALEDIRRASGGGRNPILTAALASDVPEDFGLLGASLAGTVLILKKNRVVLDS